MTKAERAIKFLIDRGSREISSSSRKYHKLTCPGKPDRFYWVGKAGAVRVGRTAGDSISVTDIVARQIERASA